MYKSPVQSNDDDNLKQIKSWTLITDIKKLSSSTYYRHYLGFSFISMKIVNIIHYKITKPEE